MPDVAATVTTRAPLPAAYAGGLSPAFTVTVFVEPSVLVTRIRVRSGWAAATTTPLVTSVESIVVAPVAPVRLPLATSARGTIAVRAMGGYSDQVCEATTVAMKF